jgi:hypothetical protein
MVRIVHSTGGVSTRQNFSLSRLCGTDALLLMVPLIENPPWTRRTASGTWQKFINQKWEDVSTCSAMRMSGSAGCEHA